MEGILYELYNGDYNIGTYRDKEEEKISKEIIPMLDEIKAKLGEEFIDRLTNLYVDRGMLSNYRYYKEGFCLGVRLMLEALTPV